MAELNYFFRHIYDTVQSESPAMTANDISAMLFCSPQTCSTAKSSGTLHLAQVRALSLGKTLQESAGSSDPDIPRSRTPGQTVLQ